MGNDLLQRRRDRVARRTFERLLANPSSYRTAPSTIAVTLLSAAVLLTAVAVVAALLWATFHASGVEWVLVALGWACVLVIRPRRHRLPEDVLVLEPEEYPGLRTLVAEMAAAVGVRPPEVVGVDLDLNAYVMPIGWRGRDALVLGLPLLSLGTWHERLGAIGHELGHLRGRDTFRARLVAAADRVLDGARYLITPAPGVEDPWAHGGVAYESTGNGFLDDLGRWVQAVLALPFVAMAWLLDRLDLASSQHREYLADRRAAEVVGSDALAATLLWDLEGIWTATAAAARREEDPFASLLARVAPSGEAVATRVRFLEQQSARVDDTHPLDHLRIKLVSAAALPPSPSMPGEAACLRAEAELDHLRGRFRRRFSEELVHGV